MTRRQLLLGSTGLVLASCSSQPSWEFIDQVQQAVVAACGFFPTVATILAILGLHDSSLQTVQQIAAAICAALASRSPQVKGVAIQGRYVR